MHILTHPETGHTVTVTPTALASGRFATYVPTGYVPTADDRRQNRSN